MDIGPIFVSDEDLIKGPSEAYINYLKLAGSMNPISVLASKEGFSCNFMYQEISGELRYIISSDSEKLTDPIDFVKISDKLKFYVYDKENKIVKLQFKFSTIDRFMLSEGIHKQFLTKYLNDAFVGLIPAIQGFSDKYMPNLKGVFSKQESAKAFVEKLPITFGETLVNVLKTKSWQYTPELSKLPATSSGRLNISNLKVDYISQRNLISVMTAYKEEKANSTGDLAKDTADLFEAIKTALADALARFHTNYLESFWTKFLGNSKYHSGAYSDWETNVKTLKNSKDSDEILKRSLGVFYESYFSPDIVARFCLAHLFNIQANFQIEKTANLDNSLKQIANDPQFAPLFEKGLLKSSFSDSARTLLNFDPLARQFKIQQKMSKLEASLSGGSKNPAGVATRLAIGIGGAFGLFYIAKNGGFSKKN